MQKHESISKIVRSVEEARLKEHTLYDFVYTFLFIGVPIHCLSHCDNEETSGCLQGEMGTLWG
jgi:hypothetical protein